MDNVKRIVVEIMDEEYVIKSDEQADYVKKLAAKVDQRMAVVAGANPRLPRNKVAVLTALNLADELYKLQQDYKQLMQIFGDNK